MRADVEALTPRFAEIRVPVEIVAAEGDRVTRVDRHARGLAETLPDAELTVLAETGHELMWTHPEEVVAAVRRAEGRIALAGSPRPGRSRHRPASVRRFLPPLEAAGQRLGSGAQLATTAAIAGLPPLPRRMAAYVRRVLPLSGSGWKSTCA